METNRKTAPRRGNTNVISTVWTHDGTQHSFRHRDTINGWINGLGRIGLTIEDVADGCPGLPESDRV